MYKRVFAAATLVACLLILQCSEKPTESERVRLGEPFVLELGETTEVQGGNLLLEFQSVLTDSRCPSGVMCFWQGIAEIVIKLRSSSGKTALVTLGVLGGTTANAENPDFVDTLGYRLSLLRLEPYPSARSSRGDSTSLSQVTGYRATLQIDQATTAADLTGSVTITDSPSDSILLDYYAIDSVSLGGDILTVAVHYGGCCKKHFFFLFMSPASFFESLPVQADLYLRHFADDDLCDCLGNSALRFDLKPIGDLYSQVYGIAEPIALNISEFTDSIPDRSFRLIYYPIGAHENRAPQFAAIDQQTVTVNDTLEFTVQATDPDGTRPTLHAVDLPLNASFSDSGDGSGVFFFTPDTSQVGEYQVTFVASDGQLADSETVVVTVEQPVLPVNHQPVLYTYGSRDVVVGGTLSLLVWAHDDDGTAPVITASGVPEHALLTMDTPAYYTFTFTPDSAQVGSHEVLFIASDGELADSETVVIRVGDTGSLIPTAVGTRWTYNIFDVDSSGGIYAAYGEISIIGSTGDGADSWYDLSYPLPPLGAQFMVRHDSVFGESGLEFVRVGDEPLEYIVTSTPGFPAWLADVPRVASQLDSVTVWAGTFRDCYRYTREGCDSTAAAVTCYSETYIIAPGLGIIEIRFLRSVTTADGTWGTSRRWTLARYTLARP